MGETAWLLSPHLSNDSRYALAEQHLTERRYDAAAEVLAVTLDAAPLARSLR